MKFDRDKVVSKLKEINERVLQKLGSPTKDQEAYPTIKKIFTEASGMGVAGTRAVLESGMLDKTAAVTDEVKAKAFQEELEWQIKRAIRTGELPAPSKDPLYKKWRPRKQKKK